MKGGDGDRLRTERLLLRRPRRGDLAAVAHTYRGTDAAVVEPRPDRAARAMLRGFRWHWRRHGYGYWALERLADARVVGFGGFDYRRVFGDGVLNLHYQLRPEDRGYGYATEMGRCALTWAAHAEPRLPVVIVTRADNHAAIRVADKLGFNPAATAGGQGVGRVEFRRPAP